MTDQTIVAKDSAYRSRIADQIAAGADERAVAVDAAVELLHAAALGGSFAGGTSRERTNLIAQGVGPIADAIQEALGA